MTNAAKATGSTSVERVEVVVAILLRVGVTISATVMVIGLLLFFHSASHGTHVATEGPTNLGAIIQGIEMLQPMAIIQAGLLLLILTPVLRVASAAIVYTIEGDRDYAVITGFVLTVLLAGMILGRVG